MRRETLIELQILELEDFTHDVLSQLNKINGYIGAAPSLDLTIKDEGNVVSNSTKYINFIGDAVNATPNGNGVDVVITGGGTGSGTLNTVKNEGTILSSSAESLDFRGDGVNATVEGNAVIVTINGGGGSSLSPSYFQRDTSNYPTVYTGINTNSSTSDANWSICKIIDDQAPETKRTVYTATGAWTGRAGLTYTQSIAYNI